MVRDTSHVGTATLGLGHAPLTSAVCVFNSSGVLGNSTTDFTPNFTAWADAQNPWRAVSLLIG